METGDPVKDLIIRINGSTAVTDEDGYYSFPSLKPSIYYLRIDKSKIGLNKVMTRKVPMEVIVKGGEIKQIDLGITTAAAFTGKIFVYTVVNDSSSDHFSAEKMHEHQDEFYVSGNSNGPLKKLKNEKGNGVTNGKVKLKKDYALENITIELKREDEVQRRLSDKNGRFAFEDLRPGKWSVKLYDFNLPEYYQFERGTFEIELKPDEKKTIEIKVIHKRRKIRFINDREILLKSN